MFKSALRAGTLPARRGLSSDLSGRRVYLRPAARVIEAGFFGTHHQCAAGLDRLDAPIKVRLGQKVIPRADDAVALYADPADMVLLTR